MTLSMLSAIFAGLAAVLWLISTKVETPKQFRITVSRTSLEEKMPILETAVYLGTGESEELQLLAKALISQSRWNAWAANCAAVSALLQAAVLFG